MYTVMEDTLSPSKSHHSAALLIGTWSWWCQVQVCGELAAFIRFYLALFYVYTQT